MSPPAAEELGYARSYTRYGVVVRTTSDDLEIKLPTHLSRRSIYSLLATTAGSVTAVIFMFECVWVVTRPSAAVFGAVLFIVAALSVYRYVARPVRVIISRKSIRVTGLSGQEGGPPENFTHPRRDVYRVYYAPAASAIFIRAHRKEMIEIPLGYDEAACEDIVAVIRDALNLPPEVDAAPSATA